MKNLNINNSYNMLQDVVISCHLCKKQCVPPNTSKSFDILCPRCGSKLHKRNKNSLNRTWAYLISAIILYIPANIYPIMIITMLGKNQSQTIISGVVTLYISGMKPLAIIVFVASIFIPILKMLCLILLLVSVHFKWKWRPRERTNLYKAIEWIGRWSMLDIFVVYILVASVQFGNFSEILPGAAALAFAAVVILTMLASHSFDSRLIWDNQ